MKKIMILASVLVLSLFAVGCRDKRDCGNEICPEDQRVQPPIVPEPNDNNG